MMKILLLASFFAVVPLTAWGFGEGAQGCAGDCTSCHSLTREEATEIFRALNPDLVVKEVGQSPAPGLFQITFSLKGQNAVTYLDYSKKHLIEGRIIDLASRSDLTQKSIEDSTVFDVSKIPHKDALLLGNPKGKKTMYIFSDPDCPFCGKLHKDVVEMVKEDPQLKVEIILAPLEMHPDAAWKTVSIVCESRKDMGQALKMLERSYEKGAVPKKECSGASVEEMKKRGKQLGVAMTPMAVFPDGKVIFGAKAKKELQAAVEKHQKKAGAGN